MKRGFDSVLIVVEEEKHGTSASIQARCFLGGARPVQASIPCARGKNGPQLAVGILGSRNTRLFRGSLPGNVPTGSEAFPGAIFCSTTLPKAVEWLPVPSLRIIAHTLGYAVTFLPVALRYGTHTLFSLQGTVDIFSHRYQKVEMAWVKTVG
jgi:hypothetical protein